MKRNTNPRPGATFSLGALAIATALAFAGQPAVAAVVTTLPDGVAQPFSLHSRPVTGPQAFGDGGTYSATNLEGVPTSSFFGYTGSFTFPSGDNWGGGEPFAAFGLQTAIMNFSFKDPVAGALAEFIWARAANTTFTLRAYNEAGGLLERLSFDANDPAYSKGFFGFQRATNDISRFEVEGYYFGVRNFSTLTSAATGAVPEPATWAMMILGFGLAGSILRTRRRAFVGA